MQSPIPICQGCESAPSVKTSDDGVRLCADCFASIPRPIRIETADAETLREILSKWNALSYLETGDPGFYAMTDHCHALFAAGENLADKLQAIADSAKH